MEAQSTSERALPLVLVRVYSGLSLAFVTYVAGERLINIRGHTSSSLLDCVGGINAAVMVAYNARRSKGSSGGVNNEY